VRRNERRTSAIATTIPRRSERLRRGSQAIAATAYSGRNQRWGIRGAIATAAPLVALFLMVFKPT